MKIVLVTIPLIIINCAPSVKRVGYEHEKYSENIDCKLDVLENQDIDLERNIKLGTIKIEDSGFSTNCGKSVILNLIKNDGCLLKAD